jgi:hypothetical protein
VFIFRWVGKIGRSHYVGKKSPTVSLKQRNDLIKQCEIGWCALRFPVWYLYWWMSGLQFMTLSPEHLCSVFSVSHLHTLKMRWVWFCVEFLVVADVWENAEGRTFRLTRQSNVRLCTVVAGLDFRTDHHPLWFPPTVHSQTKVWKPQKETQLMM